MDFLDAGILATRSTRRSPIRPRRTCYSLDEIDLLGRHRGTRTTITIFVSDGVAERSVFDLDLLIERQVDEYRACVLRSPAGDGQAVTFARPFSDPELKSLLQEMGRSRGRTRRI